MRWDRREVLLTTTGAVAVAVFPARGAGSDGGRRRTGRHGGVLVPLGPYSGELLFWETSVEMFVSDGFGDELQPRKLKARARLVRADRSTAPIDAEFRAAGDRLRADADLVGARAVEATIDLLRDGETHTGRARWRIEEDRGRLHDGVGKI
jgi:hypothetical protein